MTNLGSGEARERFATDIALGEVRVTATGVARAEAETSAATASSFLTEAQLAESDAIADLEHLRGVAVSTVEAANPDPDDRSTIRDVMAVKGASEKEIEDYFGHIDRIGAESQPIMVITGRAENVSRNGLARVVYGRTVGKGAIDYGPSFGHKVGAPGERELAIPVKSLREFTTDRTGYGFAGMRAKVDEDTTFEPVLANPDHPFEDIHFAGSVDEVSDTIEAIRGADTKTRTDHSTIRVTGTPTMVAYGDEAVVELTRRIAKFDNNNGILAARCIEGLGIDLSDVELGLSGDNEIMSIFGNHLLAELGGSVQGVLRAQINGDPNEKAEYAGKLTFLSPLQEAVGYSREKALAEVMASVMPMFMGRRNPENIPLGSVVSRLEEQIGEIEELGLRVQKGPAIQKTSRSIKQVFVETALQGVPKRKFMKRRKLNAVLDQLVDTGL